MSSTKSCIANSSLLPGLTFSVCSKRHAISVSIPCQLKQDRCSSLTISILLPRSCSLILAWSFHSSFLTNVVPTCQYTILNIQHTLHILHILHIGHIGHICSWPGKGYKSRCHPPISKFKSGKVDKGAEGALIGVWSHAALLGWFEPFDQHHVLTCATLCLLWSCESFLCSIFCYL